MVGLEPRGPWLLVRVPGAPGRQLGVLGPPGCQLGTPGPLGCRLDPWLLAPWLSPEGPGVPWLLVRGLGALLSSLILLLITVTVVYVITEKNKQTAT